MSVSCSGQKFRAPIPLRHYQFKTGKRQESRVHHHIVYCYFQPSLLETGNPAIEEENRYFDEPTCETVGGGKVEADLQKIRLCLVKDRLTVYRL